MATTEHIEIDFPGGARVDASMMLEVQEPWCGAARLVPP